MSSYLDLTIHAIEHPTPDSICLFFEEPEGGMSYQAGQFLTLIAEIEGKSVRRSYSLCTAPGHDPFPAVGIKRVPGGLMSNYINDTAQPGMTLRAMKPLGNFSVEPAQHNARHVVLLGGGSGIPPLLGIGKTILAEERESRVSLVYANRNEASIMFRSQWDELQAQYEDRLTVVHVLDEPSAHWQGLSGRLTPDRLIEIIKQLPHLGVHNTEYYICGPGGLMEAISSALDVLGIPGDRRKREVFANDLANASETKTQENIQTEDMAEDPNKAYDVTIILDGEEHTFTVEPGYSILETGLDEGIDIPYSCQSGLCTACRGKLLSGKVTMDETEGLSDEEMEEGYVLNCVGHPVTEGVRIEIG